MTRKAKRGPVGNMVIAQSGGPTMVINESVVGAVLRAKRSKRIARILGARHGIRGILDRDFIDLGRESERTLEAVGKSPSSALGSVRHKPTADECRQVAHIFQKFDVRYFFYIGGNDTAEAAHIITEECRRSHHDFVCFHIPKTVDNDLRQNDHTPGYASAARFIAQAFQGDNLDNRALGGVKIDVLMGRHAGFLTAASALGRKYEDDGPHLIYLPERPFSMTGFVRDVDRVYKKRGRCVVAVSEGIVDRMGDLIAAKHATERDAHGNVTLGGSGALGDLLARIVKETTDASRVRADTFGYMQRSFHGVRSVVDEREAFAVGAKAVGFALSGEASGSVAIKRVPGNRYRVELKRVSLRSVAKHARSMPSSFIAKSGTDISAAFVQYARPLVGPLPPVGRLREIVVKGS